MYLVTSIPDMVRFSWDTMSMFLHITGTRRLKVGPSPAGRVDGSMLPFNLSQEEEGSQAPNDSSPSIEIMLPFCLKSDVPVLILKQGTLLQYDFRSFS